MTTYRTATRCAARRRVTRRIVPLLACSVIMTACGGVDPEASFALAQTRIAEHNFREAAIHARNVLQANDDHTEARLLLARASLELADFRDAEFHLSRAASAGAPASDYAVLLAEVHLQQGNSGSALEVLDRVPDAERSAEYWITRSAAHLAGGDVDAAREALDRSGSRSAEALMVRARLAVNHRDLTAAEVLVRQAVEEDAENPNAWSLFASVVHAAGHGDEAESALDRAAELFRARGQYSYAAPTLLQLAQVQMSQGKLDQAAATAERLGARFPDSIQAPLVTGMVALRRGETQPALDALRRAAALAPNHPEVEMMLGAAHLAAGNLGQAEQRLQAALTAGSRNPAVIRMLVETRLRQGRPGPALEALSRVEPSAAEQDPALALLAGLAHLENGNAADSVRFLERAVELSPANSGAVLQLARAYGEVGRADDAARLMESSSAIAANDGYAAKAALLLQTLRTQGEDAARSFVRQLLTENPNDAENRVVAATLAYTIGDRGGAREHLGIALASDGEFVPAMLLMASLHAEDGEVAEATALLDEVLHLKPGDAAASMALARLRVEAGDEQGARSVLRDAADGSSDAPVRLLTALAELERRLGAPEEARRIAEALQGRTPPQPEGHLLAAQLDREEGRFAAAAAAFRAAYDIAPSWQALQGAVASYQEAGDGAWEPLLTSRLQADPNDVAARLLLANALQDTGRTGEALTAYDAVLARDENNIIALNNGAWIAYGRDNDKALRYARRAMELMPENPAVLDTYGWILVREGRVADALPHLEKAAQLSSGSPEIRYHLAVAQARAGQTDAARSALEALLADTPQFSSRNEAQALLESL